MTDAACCCQITPAGLAIIREWPRKAALSIRRSRNALAAKRIDQLLDMLDDLAAIND